MITRAARLTDYIGCSALLMMMWMTPTLPAVCMLDRELGVAAQVPAASTRPACCLQHLCCSLLTLAGHAIGQIAWAAQAPRACLSMPELKTRANTHFCYVRHGQVLFAKPAG